MKKILNDPFKYVDEMLEGLCLAHPDLYRQTGEAGRVIARTSEIADGKVGIGTTAPDSNLHIWKATAGSVTATSDSQLVVENSAIAGIQLLGGAGSHGIIYFGDSGNNEDGRFGYDQSDRAFYFKTAGDNTKRLFIDSAGNVGIGEATPDVLLKLNYGGDDPAGTTTRVGAFSIEGGHTTLDMGVNNDSPFKSVVSTSLI